MHAILVPVSKSSPGAMPRTVGPLTARQLQLPAFNRTEISRAAPNASWPHPPPHEHFDRYYLWGSVGGPLFRPWLGVPASTAPYVRLATFPLFVALLCMPFFGLLPASRRKAKVRWRHVLRIGVYALVPALSGGPIIVGAAIVQHHFPGPLVDLIPLFATWCFIVLPVALVVWWWQATTHYLRMPHGLGVALAAVVVSMLVTLVAGAFWFVADLLVTL